MKKAKGITVNVEMNTDKLQMKLRAIAKHTEALANELADIDNRWQCKNCGSTDYFEDIFTEMFSGDKLYTKRTCLECCEEYVYDDELPTQPEVSD